MSEKRKLRLIQERGKRFDPMRAIMRIPAEAVAPEPAPSMAVSAPYPSAQALGMPKIRDEWDHDLNDG